MKFKYTGEQAAITLRGVTFEKEKAVQVDDEGLASKVAALDFFEQVKTRRKAKSDD